MVSAHFNLWLRITATFNCRVPGMWGQAGRDNDIHWLGPGDRGDSTHYPPYTEHGACTARDRAEKQPASADYTRTTDTMGSGAFLVNLGMELEQLLWYSSNSTDGVFRLCQVCGFAAVSVHSIG